MIGGTERRGRRNFETTRAEVLGHPLRVRMLEIANERDISAVSFVRGGYASVLLEHLDEHRAVSHVSYHLHFLEERGCVEVQDTNPRRGSVETVYRGVARAYFTDDEWKTFDKERRREITAVVLQGLMARAESAVLEGTFDSRADRWLVWVQMNLTEEGWSKLAAFCQETMDSVELLREEESHARPIKGSETVAPTIPVTWGMVAFESPPAR